MPKLYWWILLGVGVVVVAVVGAMAALVLATRDRPKGALDTALHGVTTTSLHTKASAKPKPKKTDDQLCWPVFGGDPQRSLARPYDRLGAPARHYLWTRVVNSYIEYPPSYCDGTLYVNSYRGTTYAIDANTGTVRWHRNMGGTLPSTPAIDGPRLLVSSQTGGTVTALDRKNGTILWRIHTAARVESSPVVVGGIAYFGSTDGRLFAVYSRSGRVKWAYQTGGRINASPSVYGQRICISTYAGSVYCLNRLNGRKLWSTYVKRDFFRYESFYASPSTDGKRLYTISRSGRVVALDARNGHILWTHQLGGWGYTTPAVTRTRVFVGDFDGYLRAYRPATGAQVWSTYVGGTILGAPVVIGKLVFFSTHQGRTYAVQASDGKIVWHLRMGRYSPGIATERTYFFSLNGRLIAFRGRNVPVRTPTSRRSKRSQPVPPTSTQASSG